MRNLGGSVGISAVTTMLARRSQLHQERIVSHLTPYNFAYRNAIHSAMSNMIHHGAGPGMAMKDAIGSIYISVQSQALALSYLDTFKVLSVAALGMVGFILFLKTFNLKEAHAAA
jgi:DHA2 family multidrug resistance protein